MELMHNAPNHLKTNEDILISNPYPSSPSLYPSAFGTTSIHGIQRLLRINHIEIMLEPHLGVLKCSSQLCTQNLHFLRLPTPSTGIYSKRHSIEVIEVLDEIEGTDFFLFQMSAYSAILGWERECLAHQRLVLGPGANREGECLCGNVHEAGFSDPVLNLRPMKGSARVR